MDRDYIIVTNNPVVLDEMGDMEVVKGSFEDVLLKVRDLVYEGHELISHPIGASIRMLFSPYRSVLIGPKTKANRDIYAMTIEDSIDTFRRSTEGRATDHKNADDYAMIDKELLMGAIKEHSIIKKEKYQEVQ